MLQDELQSAFPAGVTVPPALVALARYQEKVSDFYSGHFEVSASNAAVYWFDGDAEAAAQFAVFGEGPDGSLVAFWLYSQQPATDAPVVFLGSEGSGNQVLAADFHDFLCLLSLGYSEFLFLTDTSLPPEPTPALLAFQSWLAAEFRISPPPDASAVLQRAKAQHPDLEAWIAAWSDRHFNRAA